MRGTRASCIFKVVSQPLRNNAPSQHFAHRRRLFPTYQKTLSSWSFPTIPHAMPTSKKELPDPSKVLVFGAGNFGSCLADHLGDSQHHVYLWAREEGLVRYFNEHHKNSAYLKDHQFSENITAVGPELPGAEMIKDMDVLLFAIPTQFLR